MSETRLTPLALLASLLASGCLELEGRPCVSGADCVADYTCAAAVCVLEPATDENAEIEESAASDLVIDQPLGALEVTDHADDTLILQITGDASVDLDEGTLSVTGDGPADLLVRLPRRFALTVTASESLRVEERDGALDLLSVGEAIVEHSLANEVAIISESGDITLTVPADADFTLDAQGERVVLENLSLSTGVNLLGSAGGVVGNLVRADTPVRLTAAGTIRVIGR